MLEGPSMYIMIGAVIVLLLIIGFVVYNSIKIKDMNNENSDTNKDNLLFISQNRTNLQLLKDFVEEEINLYNLKTKKNLNNITQNKNQINQNKTRNDNLDNRIKAQEAKNKAITTSIANNKENITTNLGLMNTTKNSHASRLNSIQSNQDNIQKNIGHFKYSDFEDITSRFNATELIAYQLENTFNSNATSVTNMNALISGFSDNITANQVNISANSENINLLKTGMENKFDKTSFNSSFNNKFDSSMDVYFKSDILPKIESNSNHIQRTNVLLNSEVDNINLRFNSYNTSNQVNSKLAEQMSNIEFNYNKTHETLKEDINDRFYDKNYINSNLSGYALKTDLSSYALVGDLDSYALKTDLSGYALTDDINNRFYTSNYINSNYTPTQGIPGLVDLSNYATTNDINNRFYNSNFIKSNYSRTTDIPSIPDMSIFAKTTDIPSIPDMSIYARTADIPSIPDMDLYARTTDIPSIPDMDLYARTADIPSLPDMGMYAKTTDLPNMSNFVTQEDLSTYMKI
jgi:hypothetical protein